MLLENKKNARAATGKTSALSTEKAPYAGTREEEKKILSTIARYCVTKSPGFAAIALWVPHFATGDKNYVARTDGRTIHAGQDFFTDYASREQAFIFMHEVLHVALRHCSRGRRAWAVSSAHATVWNLCTDAIINRALYKMSWITTPKDAVLFEQLLSPTELDAHPPQSWSAEALYHHMLDKIGMPGDKAQWEQYLDEWLEKNGLPSPDDLRRDEGEGQSSDGQTSDLKSDLAARVWASRLMRAQAGDKPGGLLRELAGDFPVVKTPWPQILRSYLQDAVMPTTRENFNRPSRRVLSLDSEFFEPSYQPENGVRRIGVAIDTSGSIDERILLRFASEVEAVQKRTGAELYVVVCDADVTGEFLIPAYGKTFTQRYKNGDVVFRGGGGTDFAPALAKLNASNVKVGLYLTDMAGNFGERKPKMPFIWCSTAPGSEAPPGFGRTIYLDPLDL
jgi:predicted metal-dependent peptidase